MTGATAVGAASTVTGRAAVRGARACRFRVDDVAVEHAALRAALRSTDSPACFVLR